MYTAVVRLIIMQVSIVCWETLRNKYNRTKLKGIQRTVFAFPKDNVKHKPLFNVRRIYLLVTYNLSLIIRAQDWK